MHITPLHPTWESCNRPWSQFQFKTQTVLSELSSYWNPVLSLQVHHCLTASYHLPSSISPLQTLQGVWKVPIIALYEMRGMRISSNFIKSVKTCRTFDETMIRADGTVDTDYYGVDTGLYARYDTLLSFRNWLLEKIFQTSQPLVWALPKRPGKTSSFIPNISLNNNQIHVVNGDRLIKTPWREVAAVEKCVDVDFNFDQQLFFSCQ